MTRAQRETIAEVAGVMDMAEAALRDLDMENTAEIVAVYCSKLFNLLDADEKDGAK